MYPIYCKFNMYLITALIKLYIYNTINIFKEYKRRIALKVKVNIYAVN
jgi:hypothetical protein